MQGKLARPVGGWGPGAIPGPTPLFIGSPEAGPRAAVLYTIVASAARHHLDVWAYLRDVLERLATRRTQNGDSSPSPKQLTSLLPDVWAKDHPESVRDYRQREQESRATAGRVRRQKRRALAQAQSAHQRNG